MIRRTNVCKLQIQIIVESRKIAKIDPETSGSAHHQHRSVANNELKVKLWHVRSGTNEKLRTKKNKTRRYEWCIAVPTTNVIALPRPVSQPFREIYRRKYCTLFHFQSFLLRLQHSLCHIHSSLSLSPHFFVNSFVGRIFISRTATAAQHIWSERRADDGIRPEANFLTTYIGNWSRVGARCRRPTERTERNRKANRKSKINNFSLLLLFCCWCQISGNERSYFFSLYFSNL